MSTDVDGSPIVILSKDEAIAIYEILLDRKYDYGLDPLEKLLINKIARNLNLKEVCDE